MRKSTLGLIFGAVLSTQVSCGERTPPPNNVPPPASESNIDIRFPGGAVQIDPNTGETHVETGRVKVDAGAGQGATVHTPNVDVDAGSGRGVHVRTPSTKVDVNRE